MYPGSAEAAEADVPIASWDLYEMIQAFLQVNSTPQYPWCGLVN